MIVNEPQSEAYDKVGQELRRGILILAALSQLHDETYGYALISHLAEHGLEIDQGTLYPLLRRLESQGLLDSTWKVEESRPRRYYVLNAVGKAALKALTADWHTLASVMNTLLAPND